MEASFIMCFIPFGLCTFIGCYLDHVMLGDSETLVPGTESVRRQLCGRHGRELQSPDTVRKSRADANRSEFWGWMISGFLSRISVLKDPPEIFGVSTNAKSERHTMIDWRNTYQNHGPPYSYSHYLNHKIKINMLPSRFLGIR
jgi:hypothetical protein